MKHGTSELRVASSDMTENRVAITGGSYIVAGGWGTLRAGGMPVPTVGEVAMPAPGEIFGELPQRYGRFDTYTRLGCAGVALALRDAGIDHAAESRSIGIVTSSGWETTVVDKRYYETAVADGGRFSSPNLFSYTLPGVMLGECAVQYGVHGPTICVGESGDYGGQALRTALGLMAGNAASVMIAGWVDDPPQGEQSPGGAVVVVLESEPRGDRKPVRWIRYSDSRVWSEEGRQVNSLLDLFGE